MHTHSNSLKRDESIESIEENWKKFRSGLRQRYYRRMCAYVRSKHAQNRKFNMTSLLKMLCKEPRTKRKFACFQESFADYLEREDTKSIETPLELDNLDEARGWRLIEFISSIVGWGKRSNGAWKDDETRLFVTAVKKHGIGNWSRIVHDFEPGSYAHVYQYRGQRRARDAKQLKDKYRNLMKTGEWQTWETEIEREQDKDKDKNS